MSDLTKSSSAHEPAEELVITDELIAEGRQHTPGIVPDDMPATMAFWVSRIDLFSYYVGRIVCWFIVPLFLAMVYEIIVRKVWTAPTLWAYDVSRMLYGALFMLGSAYALMRGVHIRADFLYRTWSARAQGIVDLILYLVLFFPSMLFFLYISADFTFEAWERGERAGDTAWMPYVGPVRSALPLGILFLVIQGVSEVLKCYYAITRRRWP
ncbi:MAG: TRAP transporter small permease subunit [Proteobacteria bacterium]|nr:TRAP transporter small permease subunit [Pseudomonadota bacterium]MCH9758882.1 TRAP transporter small permease subunit [Pseudomonadota bacterium]